MVVVVLVVVLVLMLVIVVFVVLVLVLVRACARSRARDCGVARGRGRARPRVRGRPWSLPANPLRATQRYCASSERIRSSQREPYQFIRIRLLPFFAFVLLSCFRVSSSFLSLLFCFLLSLCCLRLVF